MQNKDGCPGVKSCGLKCYDVGSAIGVFGHGGVPRVRSTF